MTWSQLMHESYSTAQSYIRTFKEQSKYSIALIVGCCVALAIGGLCYLYYSHMQSKEKMALKILNECMEEYSRVLNGQGDWATVELMGKAGYEQYAATKTAVYFIPFRVDALLALDQHDQAMALLDQMIARLSAHSPLYNLFKLKHALILLDSSEAEKSVLGLKELQELADSEKNKNRDVALYYLALYYKTHDNPELAQAAQEKLIAIQGFNFSSQSPWASLAQELFQTRAS